jgi:hypothetical protein
MRDDSATQVEDDGLGRRGADVDADYVAGQAALLDAERMQARAPAGRRAALGFIACAGRR